MVKRANKLIAVLLAAVLLICTASLTALADELRAGTVAGLPEKLVVLDDKGNSVSENGEYFFEVEDMVPGEKYTKNIQIMNLREDAGYKIYFNAQPMSKYGDIDLENECELKLYLDDRLVYSGKVTGEGAPDVRDEPLSLGKYGPGESRVLRAEIVWHATFSEGGAIDEGHRVYDFNGVKVVRPKTGKTHIEGEVIFKWIFTAVGDSPTDDSNPNPFVPTGEAITYIALAVLIVAVPVMFLLLKNKKRKQENEKSKTK
jgi:hypothetical protein